MILIPEALLGALRIGATAATAEVLYKEPLLLAAHYATVTNLVTWPEKAQATIDQVRKRYAAHDKVLDLIDTLRSQVPMALSAELARRLAEGLELHNALAKCQDVYRERCQTALQAIMKLVDSDRLEIDVTGSGRLARLATLLGLSRPEQQLMTYALGNTILPALQLFTRMFSDQRWSRPLFWYVLLDLRADELAAALSAQGRLASSGMLISMDGMPHQPE